MKTRLHFCFKLRTKIDNLSYYKGVIESKFSLISIRRSVEVIAGTEASTIGSKRKAAPLRSFSQSLKTVLDIWLLSCSYSAMHFRITLQRMPINSPADFNALISAMQTRDGGYN